MIPLPSGTRPAAWHDRSMTSQKRAQTGKGTPGSFAPAGTAGNADTVAARGYGTEPEPLACDYWEENHVPDDARTQWDEVMRQLTPESGMSPRTNLTAMTVRDTWSKDGVSAGANAVIVSRAGIRPPFGVGMNGMNVEPIPADSPYPQGPFKDAVDHAAAGVRKRLADIHPTVRVQSFDRTMELAETYDNWRLQDGSERAEFERGLTALREADHIERNRLMAAAAPVICPAIENRMRSGSYPAIYTYPEWQERLRTMHDGFRAAQLTESTKNVAGRGSIYVGVADQIAQRGANTFAEDFERL